MRAQWLAIAALVAFAGSASGQAVTQSWRRVVPDRWALMEINDYYAEFLDTTRVIRRGGGEYEVWLRRIFRMEQKTGELRYVVAMYSTEINCGRQRSRLLRMLFYDDNEKEVRSYEKEAGEMESWIPGSAGESTGRAVCKHLEPPKTAPPPHSGPSP